MRTQPMDLIIFMGQSNMAGRGDAKEAPSVPAKAGYEFRAVSAPDRLFPLTEPFGEAENNPAGVYEPGMKTGSMVSSFVNAYFKETGRPVVAVSCSKGGSSIAQWLPGTPYYQDSVHRMKRCENWLSGQGIIIAHRLMAWCQGCTDGDLHTAPSTYQQQTARMIHAFKRDCGIETCFLIQIGNHREQPLLYLPIQKAQLKLAQEEPGVVLVSRKLPSFAALGLMKDSFHYCQEGYNLAGEDAGKNAGLYVEGKLSKFSLL